MGSFFIYLKKTVGIVFFPEFFKLCRDIDFIINFHFNHEKLKITVKTEEGETL